MDERHFAFIGRLGVAGHRLFVQDLADMLSGEIALLTIGARLSPAIHPAQMGHLIASHCPGDLEYFIAFAPIGETAASAVDVALLELGGLEIVETFSGKICNTPAPITGLLGDVPDEEKKILLLIAETLWAVREGRAYHELLLAVPANVTLTALARDSSQARDLAAR